MCWGELEGKIIILSLKRTPKKESPSVNLFPRAHENQFSHCWGFQSNWFGMRWGKNVLGGRKLTNHYNLMLGLAIWPCVSCSSLNKEIKKLALPLMWATWIIPFYDCFHPCVWSAISSDSQWLVQRISLWAAQKSRGRSYGGEWIMWLFLRLDSLFNTQTSLHIGGVESRPDPLNE